MSFLSVLKRQSLTSAFDRVCDYFAPAEQRAKLARHARHLVIDPLEQRQLLSSSSTVVADTGLTISTGSNGLYSQTTTSAQSIATDDNGDAVVTWTATNATWDDDRQAYDYDKNIYAEYLTHNVQQLALEAGTSSFYLVYGGTTITQKLMLSATDAVGTVTTPDIVGTVGLSFTSGGAVYSFTIAYSETNYLNFAANLQAALQTQIGGQFANASVVADDARNFSITFNAATGGDGNVYTTNAVTGKTTLVAQNYLTVDNANTLFTSNRNGSYAAAQIGTTSVPIVLGKFYVSSSNPASTVAAINTFMEGQAANTDLTGPTDETFSGYYLTSTTVNESLFGSQPVLTSTGLDITVNSVATAADPYGLYHFQITFNGDSGYKILDKLVIVNARDASGNDVTPILNSGVTILKQSSGIFRVNNEEFDNPYTFGLDVTDQYDACVAMDGTGDFIIAWVGANTDGTTDIYARRFTTQQFVTGSAAYTDTYSYQAYLPNGTLQTYYIQTVLPEAAPQVTHLTVLDDGSTFVVNTITAQDVDEVSLAMNKTGNFVISWTNNGQFSSYFNNVYLRQFAADGKPADIERLVSNDSSVNEHHNSYVAISDSNLIAVMWESWSSNQRADSLDGVLLKWDRTVVNYLALSGGCDSGSIAFDANDDFVVSYTNYNNNNDTINDGGDASPYGNVWVAEYNSSGVQIQAPRCANSYAGDATIGGRVAGSAALPAEYPFDQSGSQVVVDADGDITVVYSGYGQDVTGGEFTGYLNVSAIAGYMLDGWTYGSKTYNSYLTTYDPTLLADLATALGLSSDSAAKATFRNWLYSGWGYSDLNDIDSQIFGTLASAQSDLTNAGVTNATAEALLGRVGALLNDVAGLLRGEANGVMYSQIDAAATAGVSNLTANATVNTYRDGCNEIVDLVVDSEIKSGTMTLRIWSNSWVVTAPGYVDVTFAPVFTNNVWDIGATLDAFNTALDAAHASLGDAWGDEVNLRVLSSSELDLRAGTAYAVLDSYGQIVTSSSSRVVFELTFQGSSHDINVDIGVNKNDLHKTQNEVQLVTIQPGSGALALQMGTGTASADFTIDTANVNATVAMLRNVIAGLATVQTGAQTGAYTVTYVSGDGVTTPIVIQVTFGGTFSGTDQGDIHSVAAAAEATVAGNYYDKNGANITSIEVVKGGADVTAYGDLVTVNLAASGTDQREAAIAVQSNGTFITAYTQYNLYSSGGLASYSVFEDYSNIDAGAYYSESILIRTFNDTTDTAGPEIAAVEAADGTRVTSGGTIATNSGVTYLVLDVNEALYNVPDVETQLEQLGVTKDAALVGTISAISGLNLKMASDAQIITATKQWAMSVLNPASYVFSLNASVLSGAVVAVNYGLNEAAIMGIGGQTLGGNKYQIVLTLDSDLATAGFQSFKAGSYSLKIKHYIETSSTITGQTGLCDAKGNPLNLNGFNSSGTNIGGKDFTFAFSVTGSASDPGGSTADNPSDPASTAVDAAISTSGKEDSTDVASDADGNYIAVWVRYDAAGNGDIIGQMFNSAGVKVEGEFIVNSDTNGTYVAGNQIDPSVSMNDAGKIVVTWTGEGPNGYGVYARCYDYDGMGDSGTRTSLTDVFYVNTPTTLNQQQCAMVALANSGAWVVTWTVKDSTTGQNHVFAKMYDKNNNALGAQFQVDSGLCTNNGGVNASANTGYDINGVDIAISATGTFVIVWQGQSNSTSWDIYGQLFSANGSKYGNEFRVNTVTASEQIMPSVSMNDAGDFVVTWSSFGQDGNSWGIYARQYNSTGGAITNKEFQVNQTTIYTQYESDVACDSTGNFTVVWTSYGQDVEDNTLPQGYGIYARMYLGDGSDYLNTAGKAVGEFRINANTPGSVPSAPTGNQVTPAIIRNATNSDAVVVWVGPDSDGTTSIFARRLDPPPESAAVKQGPTISNIVAASAAGAPTLVWAVTDGTGIGVVTLTINGTAFTAARSGNSTSAKFSASLSSLAAGTYTYVITAANTSGVISQAIGQLTVSESTVSTPLTISNVAFTATETSNILSWDVADNVAITSAILTVDGQEVYISSDTGTILGRSYAALLGDLSAGTHPYTITAIDVDNNWVVYSDTITIAAATPIKTVTLPTISNVVTTGDKITWTVTDEDGVASSTIVVDGNPMTVSPVSNTATTATYSVSLAGLASGSYNYEITATDKASESSNVTGTVTVAHSTISNVVAAATTAAKKSGLTWSVSDAAGINSVTVTLGGVTTTAVKKSGTKYSANYAYSASLTAGTYSYTITVTNANGAVTTCTGSLTVGNTASTISNVKVKASTSDKATSITWKAADIDGIASATLTIDGTAVTVKKSGSNTSASYSYSGMLGYGTHSYTITVTDSTGAVNTYSGSFTVKATVPVISSVKVTAKTAATPTTIAWKAVDYDGIGAVTLTIDGTAVAVTNNGSGSYSFTGHVAAGAHKYVITVTDSALLSKSVSGSFKVANTATVINSIVATPGTSTTASSLTWIVNDADGIQSVALTIDGSAATVTTVSSDSTSGSYAYSGVLAAGTHKYVIIVTDSTGAMKKVSGAFKVAAASITTFAGTMATAGGTAKTDWLIDYVA